MERGSYTRLPRSMDAKEVWKSQNPEQSWKRTNMSEPIPLYVCEPHYYVKVTQGKVRDYVPVYNYDGVHCYFNGCHNRVFRRILAGEGTQQTKKVFAYHGQVIEEGF